MVVPLIEAVCDRRLIRGPITRGGIEMLARLGNGAPLSSSRNRIPCGRQLAPAVPEAAHSVSPDWLARVSTPMKVQPEGQGWVEPLAV